MKLYLGGLIICAGLSSGPGVLAADPIAVPLSGSSASLPIHDTSSSADWTGFYAGIYGVAQSSALRGGEFGLGAMAGVNARFDVVLVGAEVDIQGLAGPAGADAYGQVLGRAGLLVTDDVAIYAAAGYGLDLAVPGEHDVLLGGGVEMAVADDVTVRAQYLHSFPVQGGNPKDQVSLGASFHF